MLWTQSTCSTRSEPRGPSMMLSILTLMDLPYRFLKQDLVLWPMEHFFAWPSPIWPCSAPAAHTYARINMDACLCRTNTATSLRWGWSSTWSAKWQTDMAASSSPCSRWRWTSTFASSFVSRTVLYSVIDQFSSIRRCTSVLIANLIGSSRKAVRLKRSSKLILRQGSTRNTNRKVLSHLKMPTKSRMLVMDWLRSWSKKKMLMLRSMCAWPSRELQCHSAAKLVMVLSP